MPRERVGQEVNPSIAEGQQDSRANVSMTLLEPQQNLYDQEAFAQLFAGIEDPQLLTDVRCVVSNVSQQVVGSTEQTPQESLRRRLTIRKSHPNPYASYLSARREEKLKPGEREIINAHSERALTALVEIPLGIDYIAEHYVQGRSYSRDGRYIGQIKNYSLPLAPVYNDWVIHREMEDMQRLAIDARIDEDGLRETIGGAFSATRHSVLSSSGNLRKARTHGKKIF